MNKELQFSNLLFSHLKPECRKCFIRNLSNSNNKYVNKLSFKIKPKFSKFILYQSSDSKLSTPSISTTSTSDTTNESKDSGNQFSNVNIKLFSKSNRKKIDYSQSYTANNFITAARAYNEFLLKPTDLENFTIYKRRNPFDEYGNEDLINVYLRSDAEAKAISIWGSIENIAREKEKRRLEYDQRRQAIFNLKKTLRDYQNKIESLENPLNENKYSNTTIYKTFSGKVVLSAVAVNGTNFLVKFVGWLYTGSSSLFAECIHSLADTINQLILAFGLHQSLKTPNSEHPYGYSNMTYITSLISGVGIFCFGCGLSFYHGINGLIDPHPVESLSWALLLLAGSGVSECGTLLLAYMDTRQNADKLGLKFWDYVAQGYKPSVNVVLLEDIAAVMGVTVAATCMTITHFTGYLIADSIGSLIIGGLMGGVASFIIYTNTNALVGRSIPIQRKNMIRNDLESDIMVRSIHDIKATDMGGSTVMFKAEADIDGREITRSYLEKIDIDKLLEEMIKINNVHDAEQFMLRHGENIVDRVGAEIDRIERNLRKKYPDLTHVDLEVL